MTGEAGRPRRRARCGGRPSGPRRAARHGARATAFLLIALGAAVAAGPAPAAADVPTQAPEKEQARPEAPQPRNLQRRVISEGPGGQVLEISMGPGSVVGGDEFLLKEYVDIKWGDRRLQADFVRYIPSTREAYAEGNIIFDQGPTRLTAESLAYNLETDTGTFFNARGYAEPSFYFEAARLQKISGDELVLTDATFTACTQPIPYWSFRVGHGLIRLNDYAYLHNLSFRVGRVAVFFTPYLVWPVKTDRASGLLFPEFGFSQRGGTVISNAYYWAMRRNMDATIHLDHLSRAGWGTGVQYRYVPTASGRGRFTGYFIRDQVAEEEQQPDIPVNRWVIDYGHAQEFGAGWRVVANANFVSDFDYFLDFERDLKLSTNPQALSNLFLTRSWGFYSFNVRGERREQLTVVPFRPSYGDPFVSSEEQSIVRWITPEIEIRGRRQRLGRSPLFLTLESSADYFRKGDQEGAEYGRFDLFPQISSQLSPVPWLDVDASLSGRGTYYTKSQGSFQDAGCDDTPGTGDYGEGNALTDFERDNAPTGVFGPEDDLGCDNLPGTSDAGEGNGVADRELLVRQVLDESLTRSGTQAGLTIIGPKLSRVFERPRSEFSPQYKHTIEPQLRYVYRSEVQNAAGVIAFDEIDSLAGRDNRVTYGFVTRLFAKRRAGQARALAGSPASWGGTPAAGEGNDPLSALRQGLRRDEEASGEAPEGTPAAAERPGGPAAEGASGPLSTVEVAVLQVTQDYSFLVPLSTSFALGESRNAGPVRAHLRINPSIFASLDIRTSYDVLFQQLREASLSANLHSAARGFVDLTWSMSRDLEGQALSGAALTLDRSQVGVLGETNLFRRRLLLGMQVNYELGDVLPGEPRLRDQRYKMGYNTQCCGFQVELLNRNFQDTSQREIRFVINLKGVGSVVDMHSRSTGGF